MTDPPEIHSFSLVSTEALKLHRFLFVSKGATLPSAQLNIAAIHKSKNSKWIRMVQFSFVDSPV